MNWTIWMILACFSANKVPSKSDAWLESHLQKDANIEHQVLMINEMAVRRSPLLIDDLIQITQSPEPRVRKASLEALVAYGPQLDDDRRDKQYLESLEDKHNGVRSIAKQGIQERLQSEVNTQFLTNALLQQAQDHSNWVRQLDIVQLLQWVKSPEIDALYLTLSTTAQSPQVRTQVIQSIATRQLTEARAVLHDIQRNDLDESVRQAASDALKVLGGKVNDIVAAVMPLTIQGTDPNDLTQGFQNYLSGALSSSQVATIVERGQVDTVMEELIFQDQFINDDQAIQIGQSLRAQQVITGSIQFFENKVTITVKRIDVASHEILSSAQVSGLVIDFDALQRDLAEQFVERF